MTFRRTALLMFAIMLCLGGCAKKNADQKEEQNTAQHEAIEEMVQEGKVQTMEHGEIPGDKPVWRDGVTFNKQSRDETIVVRTQALDKIYRDAMNTYGEKLRGNFTFKFTIYPDGTIGPIRVLEESWTPPEASALTDSMLQRVQRWTFPPGLEKPLSFTQPWRFEP